MAQRILTTILLTSLLCLSGFGETYQLANRSGYPLPRPSGERAALPYATYTNTAFWAAEKLYSTTSCVDFSVIRTDALLSGGNCASLSGAEIATDDSIYNLQDSDFEYSAWIKPDSTGGSLQTIKGKWEGTTERSFWFFVDRASARLGCFSSADGTGAPYQAYSTNSALTLDAWNLVTFSRSGTTVSFFVGGVAKGSGSFAPSPFSQDTTQTTAGLVGQQFFKGEMALSSMTYTANPTPVDFDYTFEEDIIPEWNGMEWTTTFDVSTKAINSTNLYLIPTEYNSINNAIAQINTDGVADARIVVSTGTYVNGWRTATATSANLEVVASGVVTFKSTAGLYCASIPSDYFYCEGIIFDADLSSNYALGFDNGGTNSANRHYLKNCVFKNGIQNGFYTKSAGEMYVQNCIGDSNKSDGFHYISSGVGVGGGVVEIDCHGINNGVTDPASNGSSLHYGWRSIRVGGVYTNNFRNIHDVLGTQSILYSCAVNTSRGAAGVDTSFNAGVGYISHTSTSSTMWLFDCGIGGGSTTDGYVGYANDKLYNSQKGVLISNANGGTYLQTNLHGDKHIFSGGFGMATAEPDVSGNGNDCEWDANIHTGSNSLIFYNLVDGCVTWTNGVSTAYVPFIEWTETPALTNVAGYTLEKVRPSGLHNGAETSFVIGGVTNNFTDLLTNGTYNASTNADGFIIEIYVEN